MGQISQQDWNTLLGNIREQSFKRSEAITKLWLSLVFIFLYMSISFSLGWKQDVNLIAFLIPVNVLSLVIIYWGKSRNLHRWVVYFSLLTFMLIMAYIAWALNEPRGLIYYALYCLFYFFELERLAWQKWQIPLFAFFSILPLLFLPYSLKIRIPLAVAFLFMALVVIHSNKRRSELQFLVESRRSYDLFMKHTRLIEHRVINAVSKLVYVSEKLKQKKNLQEEDHKLIAILDDQIEEIGETITKMESKDLHDFNI